MNINSTINSMNITLLIGGIRPRGHVTGVWVFRDVVFRDVGFEDNMCLKKKLSATSALGVKSPHPSVVECQPKLVSNPTSSNTTSLNSRGVRDKHSSPSLTEIGWHYLSNSFWHLIQFRAFIQVFQS